MGVLLEMMVLVKNARNAKHLILNA